MRQLRWAMVASAVVAILAGAGLTVRVAPAGAQAPAQAPPAQPGGSPASKIAFVDVNRVLARSAAGAQAREALERERAAMQKEFDGKAEEIKRLGEELEKKGPLMTAEVRREKQDLYERKARYVTRLFEDFRKELEKKEQGLGQRVLREIAGVIDRVGKERKYYMIVEKGVGVVYASAEADITEEIIKAYDQESGKGKK